MKTPETINPPEICSVKARCQKCRVSILFTPPQWRLHGSVSPCLCGGTLKEEIPMDREMQQEEFFEEPKSWCYCGHLGDGLNSQHAGINGHGRCEFNSCDCDQFTWKRFTNRFNEWRARREE